MADLIGQTLGGYQVIRQVGKGGMATVYKAYQPSLDRYVALKVMPAYYAQQDEAFLKRFQREARAIAKLRHPNILIVLDFGEQEGITYIVMEYVDAGTLNDRLGQPLPMDEIAVIIDGVAGALDYAHDQGIIHRDVKPSNVLLPKPDWPLLTDFGLAKIVGGSKLTTSGMMAGTPAYVSPEQGRGDRVDNRTDVYSLGIVLYEMATGVVPFSAETPMAVVVKHIIEPLPLPRSKNPELPESVERVILKSLVKNPEDRFQRAGDMADALRKAVEAEGLPTPTVERQAREIVEETVAPISKPMISTPDVDLQGPTESPSQPAVDVSAGRPGEPRRLKRWMVATGLGAAALVIVLSGATILGSLLKGSPPLPPSALPETTQTMPAEGPGPTRTLEQYVADAHASLERGEFEAAAEAFEAALGLAPEAIDLYWELVNVYIDMGRPGDADRTIQRAIEVAPEDAGVLESAGWSYIALNLHERAIAQFERARELNPESSGLYFGLAEAFKSLGDLDGALEALRGILALTSDEDPDTFESLGWGFLDLGALDEAGAAFQRAVAIAPTYASAWEGLSEVKWQRGDLQGALEVVQMGLEANPESAGLYEKLARSSWELGDLERAENAFNRAIELDPQHFAAYSGLADLLRQTGRQEEASALLRAAIERNPEEPSLYQLLADYHVQDGEFEAAVPLYERALELSPDDGWLRVDFALASKGSGDVDRAHALLEEAAAMGPDDPGLLESIGWAYFELGDCGQAVSFFQRALKIDSGLEGAVEGLSACGT